MPLVLAPTPPPPLQSHYTHYSLGTGIGDIFLLASIRPFVPIVGP